MHISTKSIRRKDMYKVYRQSHGIIEERYKGTHEECRQYIAKRGDSNKSFYYIERAER